MKKILGALSLLLAGLLAACGIGYSEARSVTLLAANVGKGDALVLKVDDYACLIDAGKPHARGKVRAALQALGVTALDAVFLTHTDNDHAGGLEWLAQDDIPVGAWYAPGMFTGVKKKKHPIVKAADERDQSPKWLERGDTIPLGNTGAVLRVLAPATLFTDKDDNNSLVMMLETSQGRMLLTGDMELPEEADLLEYDDDLHCDVLKAPNHGDDDTLSEAFAEAVSAKVCVISTDSAEKPDTPDPGVLARLTAVGTKCYVTQDATLGVRVTLNGGNPEVTYLNIEAPMSQAITVQASDADSDLVTLYNPGPDCDMTGWYLYSDRGDELYAFPAGTVFPAGQTLTLGSHKSPRGYDLLWDVKRIHHKSKEDHILLYDPYGRCVDRL